MTSSAVEQICPPLDCGHSTVQIIVLIDILLIELKKKLCLRNAKKNTSTIEGHLGVSGPLHDR